MSAEFDLSSVDRSFWFRLSQRVAILVCVRLHEVFDIVQVGVHLVEVVES